MKGNKIFKILKKYIKLSVSSFPNKSLQTVQVESIYSNHDEKRCEHDIEQHSMLNHTVADVPSFLPHPLIFVPLRRLLLFHLHRHLLVPLPLRNLAPLQPGINMAAIVTKNTFIEIDVFGVFFFFVFFFWGGGGGWGLRPVKIISLILSQVNRKVGQNWEIYEKNHLTTRKQNLARLTCDSS